MEDSVTGLDLLVLWLIRYDSFGRSNKRVNYSKPEIRSQNVVVDTS